MPMVDEQMQRLASISNRAVVSLGEIARLVDAAYGAASTATSLAQQAHVHARILSAEIRMQEAIEEARVRDLAPGLDGARLEEHVVRAGLTPLAHEHIGDELKLLQREVTRLCVERREALSDAEQRLSSWLGKLDHLLRKLRSELDARALRELPRPGLSRAPGYYYGESLHQRA